MHIIDYTLVVTYLVVLLGLGFVRRLRPDSSANELIVGGRMLTLPAFVASLVSTWYGGILGVGEYAYSYGLSNWLVFGLPYYLAATLFALFLAKKARTTQLLTIPDRLLEVYDRRTSVAAAVIIFVMTVPAAYVLMLGVLGRFMFGWPMWVGVLAGTLFSIIYVYFGGFRSVVRTDLLQFALMFIGFILLMVVLISTYGGLDFLRAHLPDAHLTWHGGQTGWYIAMWYVVALAALIEPAFYQRCFAVRDIRTARLGIFISIGCWAFFDFMTTTCGLYARVLLPNLSDPVAAFPELAQLVLPAGLLGLFLLALLATVMSTVDSNSFLAATTFGRDIIPHFIKQPANILRHTRIGLLLATAIALVLALMFESVIDIWHAFGSIGTPALLIPVLSAFVGKRRLSPRWAFVSIVASGSVAFCWYLSKYVLDSNEFLLDVQPIFPGIVVSLAIYLAHVYKSDT